MTNTRRPFLATILVISVAAVAQLAPPQRRGVPPENATVPAPRVTVRDASFHSVSLSRDMKYRILLPAGYENSPQRYPVLYLLHGLTGSYVDWDSKTHLAEYAAPLSLIIVMPDAGDSWYTNSAANPQDRFEDYIAKDLIAEIDKTYRTIATRHGRAIAGLSMGGYGAMKFAFKYPQLFVFAASFSGVFETGRPEFKIPFAEKFNQEFAAIYGPPGGPTRAENDVLELAKKADPARLPFLWVVCGTEDGLLTSNHDLMNLLDQRKIPHFYAESAGAHTWGYWDEQLPLMMATLFRRYFRPVGPMTQKRRNRIAPFPTLDCPLVMVPARRVRSFPGRRCSIAPTGPLPGAWC